MGEEAHIPGFSPIQNVTPSIHEWLLSLQPSSVIYLYLDFKNQIPERNTYVVSTNPFIHNATGSSTNAVLLGNTFQSRGSLFYIAPYICKNKVVISKSLVAMEKAMESVSDPQKRSVAADTGTNKRYVQHMFTRVMNNLSKSVQLSDTQMALSLLNTGTEISSDTYRFFGADYAVNHFLHEWNMDNTTTNVQDCDVSNIDPQLPVNDIQSIPEEVECVLDDSLKSIPHQKTPITSHKRLPKKRRKINKRSGLMNFGPAPVYTSHVPTGMGNKTEVEMIPVHYPTHWWYRGKQLATLTMFEYAALVCILPYSEVLEQDPDDNYDEASSDSDSSSNSNLDVPCFRRRGRPKRKHFPFHPKHPLYESHTQCLRAKQPTMIFNSYVPSHPGVPPTPPDSDASPFELTDYMNEKMIWEDTAAKFANYYSIVFLEHPEIYGDINTWKDQSWTRNYLSWDNFCHRIEIMETSSRLVDFLRLESMYTYIDGTRSSGLNDILMNNYRLANATKWNDEERNSYATLYKNIKKRNYNQMNQDDDALEHIENTQTVFSSKTISDAQLESAFCRNQFCSLTDLFKNVPNPSLDMNTDDLPPVTLQTAHQLDESPSCPIQYIRDVKDLHTTVANIKSAQLDTLTTSLSNEDVFLQDHTTAPLFNHDPEEPSSKRHCSRHLSGNLHDAHIYIKKRNLSGGQNHCLQQVLTYFIDIANYKETKHTNPTWVELQNNGYKPPRILLTGDPGTGKSYLIDTIRVLAGIMDVGSVATSSYNGIASVNVDGNTVCSMFGIFDTGEHNTDVKFDRDLLSRLHRKIDGDNLSFLIIDEVSTIDAKIIAILDLRLQQMFDNTLPFGGVPLIFAGDFNQLGPVQKTFLPRDMMNWASRLRITKQLDTPHEPCSSVPLQHIPGGCLKTDPVKFHSTLQNAFGRLQTAKKRSKLQKKQDKIAEQFKPHTLSYRGCYLFSTFQRFHLLEQMRACKDKKHFDFVQKLSKGNRVELEDILNYKHLSQKDIDQHPEEWKFAPVLVSTNKQRHNISRYKAHLWAVQHNTYVFKWKTKAKQHKNKPNLQKFSIAREKNAFFWQFWIQDAPAFLNQTLNGEMGLVNSAPITLDSMNFSNSKEFKRIKNLISGPDKLPFGTEIEIEPPISVNVKVSPTLDDKDISPRRQSQLDCLQSFSIVDDHIVLPITKSMAGYGAKYKTYSYASGNPFSPLSKVKVSECFPYDLAFSMTVHKAQGRTISRVVLDLTDFPSAFGRIKFAALYVAMSRVQFGCHIRLLPHTNGSSPFDPMQHYKYISSLKPDRDAMAFYYGFSNSDKYSSTWSPRKALQYI